MADEIYEIQKVDLIVGKYEWTCPHCETLNEEIELPRDNELECQNDSCRRTSTIHDYFHAYE